MKPAPNNRPALGKPPAGKPPAGKKPPALAPGEIKPKAHEPLPKRPDTGEVAAHRIPIFDHKGNMRGHVGHRATGATVARFLGRHGADLTDKDGRVAWVGHKPPPPPPPPPTILPDGRVIPGHPGGPPNVIKGAPPMGGQPGKGGSPVGQPTGGREKSPDIAAAKGSVKKPPGRGK